VANAVLGRLAHRGQYTANSRNTAVKMQLSEHQNRIEAILSYLAGSLEYRKGNRKVKAVSRLIEISRTEIDQNALWMQVKTTVSYSNSGAFSRLFHLAGG
jgi:hypothetical protein